MLHKIVLGHLFLLIIFSGKSFEFPCSMSCPSWCSHFLFCAFFYIKKNAQSFAALITKEFLIWTMHFCTNGNPQNAVGFCELSQHTFIGL